MHASCKQISEPYDIWLSAYFKGIRILFGSQYRAVNTIAQALNRLFVFSFRRKDRLHRSLLILRFTTEEFE